LKSFQDIFDQLLDTFFHLPTLLVAAIVAVLIVWQVYDFSLNVGSGFIRLDSNQGSTAIYWQNGCCYLDW
jgi:hypothetical protein